MEKFIELIYQFLQHSDLKKLNNNLNFVDEILLLIINQIKKTDTPEEAELVFDLLNDIQLILAKMVFKEQVKVTPQLNKFIHDFDRLDDQEVKRYLYSKIKANEYSL